MPQLVLIDQAAQLSAYDKDHIRYLARKGFIRAEKHGRIWLVDPESLQAYETRMNAAGTKKFDPTKYQDDS